MDYNINSHIKRYILKKMLIKIVTLVIFISSIAIDLALFFEGKQLEDQLQESYDVGLNDVKLNIESEDYEYYREKYKNLDLIQISSNLEKLTYLNYTQIRFSEDKIYIDLEHSFDGMLQKSIDYLKNSGFSVRIDSLRSQDNMQYVTMEVSRNG